MKFLLAFGLLACSFAVDRSMHRVKVANVSLAEADEGVVTFAQAMGKDMPRFQAAQAIATANAGAAAGSGDDDEYKFPEPLAATAGTSVAEGGTFEGGVDVAKYLTKIKKIDEQMMTMRKDIRQAILGCEKVTTLKAMYDGMIAERERLNQLKRKKILQAKLDKQNKDLNVVDRMADNLRDRFAELRRTQGALRENIQGTAEDLQSVMGAGGALPPINLRSPLANDMHETHGYQRQAVEQIQDGNLDRLVGFFKNALKMPIKNPADAGESASGSGSGSASAKSL